MSLTVLDNISAIDIGNQLARNQVSTQKDLTELTTGSRINSGADDPAGLSISDSLAANIAALQQSALNVQQGIALLQTADSALAQVTQIVDRIEALAVEDRDRSLQTAAQVNANAVEYDGLLNEISNIGASTEFNGQNLFGISPNGPTPFSTFSIVTSDGTAGGTTTDMIYLPVLQYWNVGSASGYSGYGAAFEPGADYAPFENNYYFNYKIDEATQAVQDVATERGYIGSQINALQASENVDNTERINLTAAQDGVQAADYGKVTANLVRESVLNETAISALSQTRANREAVLKLLQ